MLLQLNNTQAQSIPSKPTDISPLLIGEVAPAITLQDANAKDVNLTTALQTKPTVLIFYRGGFCPYCNTQLAELQKIEQDILSQGYQIVAISPDSPSNLQTSIKEYSLNYRLLSDDQLLLSQAFGVAFEAPTGYKNILLDRSNGRNGRALLPVPSVFVLDTTGTIQFSYISPNYKVRLNSALLLAVLANL